jgi:hypothetical protein
MKFAITVVSPPGYVHSAAFHEVAESLHYGLKTLGHESVITTQAKLSGYQHIVLGANLLPYYPLPLASDAIIYNLEQIHDGSEWIRPELINIFRRYSVWDYSEKNFAALQALGILVKKIVPIGYTKELSRIQLSSERDIDVLFVGSINQRRQNILEKLSQKGLRVTVAFGLFGKERDKLIGRAKLLINIHYYESKVLEMVRISYLLANRCTVLSEYSSNSNEDIALSEGVAFAHYDHLVQRACELVTCPDERDRLAQRGFELISNRPIAAYLQEALL